MFFHLVLTTEYLLQCLIETDRLMELISLTQLNLSPIILTLSSLYHHRIVITSLDKDCVWNSSLVIEMLTTEFD